MTEVIVWVLLGIGVGIAIVINREVCPVCKNELDYNYIGYERKHGYCHKCGYRTDDRGHLMNQPDNEINISEGEENGKQQK